MGYRKLVPVPLSGGFGAVVAPKFNWGLQRAIAPFKDDNEAATNEILARCIVSWNLTDEAGNVLPIDPSILEVEDVGAILTAVNDANRPASPEQQKAFTDTSTPGSPDGEVTPQPV